MVTLEKPVEAVPPPEEEPIHPPRGLTLRRFRPVWPARVDFDGHRPGRVETEQLREVVHEAIGPFRLSGQWWKPSESWRVETWQVEIQSGVVYQLARTREGWCVEGVLD